MSLVEELASLKRKDGTFDPKDVLEFAKGHPGSHIYGAFDRAGLWSDEKAAERGRLDFSRELIRRYQIKIVGNDGKPSRVRATIATREDRLDPGCGSYRMRADVMSDKERLMQMHRACASEIRSVVKRYCDVLSSTDMETLRSIAAAVEQGPAKRKSKQDRRVSSIDDIRPQIFDLLASNGAMKPAVIASELAVPVRFVNQAIDHEWFEKTPTGIRNAEVAA